MNRNYVYRSFTPSMAAAETRRLLAMLRKGGQEARDALTGLVVLAGIGFVSAGQALSASADMGYAGLIEEIMEGLC